MIAHAFCMVGDQLTGPFTLRGDHQILPPDRPEQPYACQWIRFRERDHLIGTVWNDEQDFLSDPVEIRFTPRGIVVEG